MGGMLKAIESSFPQSEIEAAAYASQRAVEAGEQVIVGVNRFRMDEAAEPPVFRIDPAIEKAQIERLREVRASRSATDVESKLHALESAARGTENLMPHILAAAEAYATVGEISDALRRVFGEYRAGG